MLTCCPVLLSGGEEVILDVAGQDASEAFEDVGHSDEARESLDELLVGTLKRAVSIPNAIAPTDTLDNRQRIRITFLCHC